MDKPKPIYKYTRISEHLKKSLRGSYLWFSKPEFLNDPFDLMYRFSDEFINNVGRDSDLDNSNRTPDDIIHDESIIESIRARLDKVLLHSVCCFTEDENNLLMWPHYADNHTGVCLIYDFEKTQLFWNVLCPVNYAREYPVVDNLNDLNKALLTKSLEWSYEKEWRILNTAHVGGEMPIIRNYLKGIIFGCRTSTEQARDIISICKESGYKDLVFYVMIKDQTQFKLLKQKILG